MPVNGSIPPDRSKSQEQPHPFSSGEPHPAFPSSDSGSRSTSAKSQPRGCDTPPARLTTAQTQWTHASAAAYLQQVNDRISRDASPNGAGRTATRAVSPENTAQGLTVPGGVIRRMNAVRRGVSPGISQRSKITPSPGNQAALHGQAASGQPSPPTSPDLPSRHTPSPAMLAPKPIYQPYSPSVPPKIRTPAQQSASQRARPATPTVTLPSIENAPAKAVTKSVGDRFNTAFRMGADTTPYFGADEFTQLSTEQKQKAVDHYVNPETSSHVARSRIHDVWAENPKAFGLLDEKQQLQVVAAQKDDVHRPDYATGFTGRNFASLTHLLPQMKESGHIAMIDTALDCLQHTTSEQEKSMWASQVGALNRKHASFSEQNQNRLVDHTCNIKNAPARYIAMTEMISSHTPDSPTHQVLTALRGAAP